jgi:metal-responsive CopG/Arc/MetJ family transcriptional regulator
MIIPIKNTKNLVMIFGKRMKTIEIPIDEALLVAVDEVVRDLKITRPMFISSALQLALRQHAIAKLEEQHTLGYTNYPIKQGEFDEWETEQVWGE